MGQIFFARCPQEDGAALASQYHLGGYILFGRDFKDKTAEQVKEDIASYQSAVEIPMLIGVDEEGGTVVRVSSNPKLRPQRFQSPQALYEQGGIEAILADTQEKDELLRSLGINVNFAPGGRSVHESRRLYLRPHAGSGRRGNRRLHRPGGRADVSGYHGLCAKAFPRLWRQCGHPHRHRPGPTAAGAVLGAGSPPLPGPASRPPPTMG